MTSVAVGLSCVDGCRSFATVDVDQVWDWVHVPGVDTVPLPTEMVEFGSIWNGTDVHLVDNAVCAQRATSSFRLSGDDSVSLVVRLSGPQPTLTNVSFCEVGASTVLDASWSGSTHGYKITAPVNDIES